MGLITDQSVIQNVDFGRPLHHWKQTDDILLDRFWFTCEMLDFLDYGVFVNDTLCTTVSVYPQLYYIQFHTPPPASADIKLAMVDAAASIFSEHLRIDREVSRLIDYQGVPNVTLTPPRWSSDLRLAWTLHSYAQPGVTLLNLSWLGRPAEEVALHICKAFIYWKTYVNVPIEQRPKPID